MEIKVPWLQLTFNKTASMFPSCLLNYNASPHEEIQEPGNLSCKSPHGKEYSKSHRRGSKGIFYILRGVAVMTGTLAEEWMREAQDWVVGYRIDTKRLSATLKYCLLSLLA